MKILAYALVMLSLLSCKEQGVIAPVPVPVQAKDTGLFGSWVVTQYLLTNGPICYDIFEGDTVSFEKMGQPSDAMIFNYRLFYKDRRDTFLFENTAETYQAKGNYLYADSMGHGPDQRRPLQQTLDIELLPDHQIECNMKIESYNYPRLRISNLEGEIK